MTQLYILPNWTWLNAQPLVYYLKSKIYRFLCMPLRLVQEAIRRLWLIQRAIQQTGVFSLPPSLPTSFFLSLCVCVCVYEDWTQSLAIWTLSFILVLATCSCNKIPNQRSLKGGGFILAHGVRDKQSIKVGKAWQQECEIDGHVVSAVRKQVSASVQLIFTQSRTPSKW